jgi:uncharacterized protein (TIGR00255 family)
MIYSMTGYGKNTTEFGNKKINIEIRSLNSKQLDFSLRIPSYYKEKESEIRAEISKRIIRGKVELFVTVEEPASEKGVQINKELIKNYYNQFSELARELGVQTSEDIYIAALRMPDAISTDAKGISDEEYAALINAVSLAVDGLDAFRKQEGDALLKDLLLRVSLIEKYLEEVTPFEQGRTVKIRERIAKNLDDMVGKENVDLNRLEQELIFYIEKLDITEEKVRLRNHCVYFRETVGEEQAGKKLSFIAQEMGREINTIGSKANDSDIQRRVVMMKDELEKIKEQINNVL